MLMKVLVGQVVLQMVLNVINLPKLLAIKFEQNPSQQSDSSKQPWKRERGRRISCPQAGAGRDWGTSPPRSGPKSPDLGCKSRRRQLLVAVARVSRGERTEGRGSKEPTCSFVSHPADTAKGQVSRLADHWTATVTPCRANPQRGSAYLLRQGDQCGEKSQILKKIAEIKIKISFKKNYKKINNVGFAHLTGPPRRWWLPGRHRGVLENAAQVRYPLLASLVASFLPSFRWLAVAAGCVGSQPHAAHKFFVALSLIISFSVPTACFPDYVEHVIWLRKTAKKTMRCNENLTRLWRIST